MVNSTSKRRPLARRNEHFNRSINPANAAMTLAAVFLLLSSSTTQAFGLTNRATHRTRIPLLISGAATSTTISSTLYRHSNKSQLHAVVPHNNQDGNADRCSDMEFELRVGKALDTLRRDYVDKNVLVSDPDYSIYAPRDMKLVDVSGVTVHGLRSYQNAVRLLHALVKLGYCPTTSRINSFRMIYDPTKRCIRIHWNAVLYPREIFGGSKSKQHVDGISIYQLDRASGLVTCHKLEQLIVNNQAISPKEGVVEALSKYQQKGGQSVPSFCGEESSAMMQQKQQQDLFTARFLPWNSHSMGQSLFTFDNKPESELYSMEASQRGSDGGGSADGSALDIDWEALERKNVSRKKFGMAPLTPQEFVQLQSTVQQMDAAQQIKQQQQAAALKEQEEKERALAKAKENNVLGKLFGNVLKDTCQDNFDCQRPQVCCDFGFKKMCCASGSPVLGQEWKPATVPVPVGTQDPPGSRRGPLDGGY